MDWRSKYAYGGIVFNHRGEVLMRSPSGFWGGYAWTFAKGSAEPVDTSPEGVALREVHEETGYTCDVLAPIPGEFESDTCTTRYFLMNPTGSVTSHDDETQAILWVDVTEAFELIELTQSVKGRRRDADALRAAIRLRQSLNLGQAQADDIPNRHSWSKQ